MQIDAIQSKTGFGGNNLAEEQQILALKCDFIS